jgi:hypothetical protein
MAKKKTKKSKQRGEDHRGKVCAMICCGGHLDLEELKPVVRDAKFICRKCGHVAAKKKHLCGPMPLD